MKYRYKLEKGSKKYFCPACNKKTFVRYIDNSTNDLAPDQFGRCDRESKCNYHSYPKSLKNDYLPPVSIPKQIRKPQRVFIPNEVLKTTIQGYEYNAFVKNLCKMFPVDGISKVLSEYCLGTVSSGYMKGGCTFPFIDKDSKIRAIQCKTFDNENHTINTNFLPNVLESNYKAECKPIPQWIKDYSNNELKVSCLFGEHLLNKYPNAKIGLVEAPKTAICNTLYFNNKLNEKIIWLGVFNLSSLNLLKCKVLAGRNVVLFPDTSKNSTAFVDWKTKADSFNKEIDNATFKMFDGLEQLPEEQKNKGLDLADIIQEQLFIK